MAIDQHLQEAVTQHEVGGNGSPLQKWKPDSDAATASDDATACFDCNICLECAQDPVVTLCGHLYCWPCIYKWLNLEGSSAGSEQLQQCPVCKADVSHTTIVPLYGRGQAPTPTESESKSPQAFEIPRRPPACGVNALITTSTASRPGQQLHRNPYQSDPQASHQQYYPHQYRNFVTESSPMFNLRGTMTTNFFHPMAGMLWEMVYQRMFGNSQSETSFYASPNSYYLSSPRVTRQVMQADKSLNRISIFLLCCLVLCLLLF